MKLVLISARGEQEPPSFPNEFPYHGEFHQTKRDTLCMYADPRIWVSGSEQAEVGSVSCCDPTRELASEHSTHFHTHTHTCTRTCGLQRLLPCAHRYTCWNIYFKYIHCVQSTLCIQAKVYATCIAATVD